MSLNKVKPDFKKEKELWKLGFEFVCGIDEAGRGAIAGPLVAGGVILKHQAKPLYNDSKLLTSKVRLKLFDEIKKQSVAWAIGISSVSEIYEFGIQTATYLAYERVLTALKQTPSFLLLDYYRMPSCEIPQVSITKGDQKSQSIAAASIVAKVSRDLIMSDLAKTNQQYQFHSSLNV